MLKDSPVDVGTPPTISQSDVGIADLDDTQLTNLARRGNSDAFGALFARHRQVALRLARHLAPRSEADDIVSESFAQVFVQLRKGGGPTTQFRSYLLTSVRHEAGRRAKARRRTIPTDDQAQIDSVESFHDRASEAFEDATVRKAFDSLPDRWREVLWHLDVQGSKPQDVADQFSLTANGVSALGYRARNGLREAYVQAHVRDAGTDGLGLCQAARPLLAGYVRGRLSRRDSRQLEQHLDACVFCANAHAEVMDVNSTVAASGATSVLGLTGGWFAKPFVAAKAGVSALAAPMAASVVAAGFVTIPILVTPDSATAGSRESSVAPVSVSSSRFHAPAVPAFPSDVRARETKTVVVATPPPADEGAPAPGDSVVRPTDLPVPSVVPTVTVTTVQTVVGVVRAVTDPLVTVTDSLGLSALTTELGLSAK